MPYGLDGFFEALQGEMTQERCAARADEARAQWAKKIEKARRRLRFLESAASALEVKKP